MTLRKFWEIYIRGFDKDAYPEAEFDYKIVSKRTDWDFNKDAPAVFSLMLFSILWLGIENYSEIIEYVIQLLRNQWTIRR